MSQQPDAFLQMAASYNFDRDSLNKSRHQTISSDNFQKWTQNYMYKTSYAHFHSKESEEPKNTAIPGYAGYIPGVKAENMHGRGFSAMARESFKQQNLGRNTYGLATTGFNLDRTALIDRSKVASSSKYGKSQIQRAHPGWDAKELISTNHQSFKAPQDQVNPTYRPTDKYLQTQKAITKSSGFARNNSQQDGYGWKPDPVLKGDNTRTQYRDRYNAEHPFHRNTHLAKTAKLPRKQYNYKFT